MDGSCWHRISDTGCILLHGHLLACDCQQTNHKSAIASILSDEQLTALRLSISFSFQIWNAVLSHTCLENWAAFAGFEVWSDLRATAFAYLNCALLLIKNKHRRRSASTTAVIVTILWCFAANWLISIVNAAEVYLFQRFFWILSHEIHCFHTNVWSSAYAR